MALLYRVRTFLEGGLVTGGGLSDFYFLQVTGTAAQANAAVGLFWAPLQPGMSPQVTWRTDGEVLTIDDATGDITATTAVTPLSGVGTQTGEPLPPATQGLITLRTGAFVLGKEIRGRKFIPGICEADNTSTGAVSSTQVNRMNNAINALIADANSTFAIYSPTKHTSANVTSGAARTYFAVLRGRRD